MIYTFNPIFKLNQTIRFKNFGEFFNGIIVDIRFPNANSKEKEVEYQINFTDKKFIGNTAFYPEKILLRNI